MIGKARHNNGQKNFFSLSVHKNFFSFSVDWYAMNTCSRKAMKDNRKWKTEAVTN